MSKKHPKRRHFFVCLVETQLPTFSIVHKAAANPLSLEPQVTEPGWWQIVEELSAGVFTPATELFPPDGLWNDGQTVLPGEDGWSVDPILNKLQELQDQYGRSFGANFQWPA